MEPRLGFIQTLDLTILVTPHNEMGNNGSQFSFFRLKNDRKEVDFVSLLFVLEYR